jgi:hypothetical protein
MRQSDLNVKFQRPTAKGEKIFESKKMTERRDDMRCDVKCGRAALKSRQGKRLGTGAEV